MKFDLRRFITICCALAICSGGARAADYLLVIDSSGSMKEATSNGQTKIEAAKQALSNLKNDLHAHQVGIMVFGHTKNPKEDGCCKDIEFVLPIGPVSAGSFEKVIQRIQPKGSTPLAESLERAKYVMLGRDLATEKFIVVVTDGNETCNGDPAAQAADIRNKNINVVTHVVGFGVTEKESKQLRDIATAGGGQYRSANEMKGLVRAIALATGTALPESEAPQATSENAIPELSAIEKLLVERLSDEDRSVRNQAAKTLHKRKALAAIPHLIKSVQDDFMPYNIDNDIPFNAVKELAPEKAIETLLKALEAKNIAVQAWAATRLGEHGGPVASAGLNGVDQALVKHLFDADRSVAIAAAKSLQARKVTQAAPQLIKRIANDVFSYNIDKDAPLSALKEVAPDRVEEALVGALKSKNAAVRAWASKRLEDNL